MFSTGCNLIYLVSNNGKIYMEMLPSDCALTGQNGSRKMVWINPIDFNLY